MRRNTSTDNVRDQNIEDDEFFGTWPHVFNPALACLGCTLGLFNIDRFAMLSIEFGTNFIIQFLIMSLLLGIPLLTLQVCLGQKLKTGVLSMWKISPLFQGVGIALLIVHAYIGIYSVVGVSWIFVYLRDSFITKQKTYRWAENNMLNENNSDLLTNSTLNKLFEIIPNYFNQVVLQRMNLSKTQSTATTLKFQVAFNLAVVWMIIYISLSKGLKSYGKVIHFYTLIPILSHLILCIKVLYLVPQGSLHKEYSNNTLKEFFDNGKSWTAATSEAFFTWSLLSAAAMQIASHNKDKNLLRRNIMVVIILTIVVLFLNAFIANSCVKILENHEYIFTATSFEKISSYKLHHTDYQPTLSYNSNGNFKSRASLLLGQRIIQDDKDSINESSYHVLRYSTELVPSAIALLGTQRIAPVWTISFYLALILFGITQQLAIWYCVITGVLSIIKKSKKPWKRRITLFSCICAYILGLPMATDFGIHVIYYLDYVIGGSWWIMILYSIQLGIIFAVGGRSHTGDSIAAELFSSTNKFLQYWAAPILSFIWNIISPILLGTLSVVVFKSGGFRELYLNHNISKDFWTIRTKQIGISIQLIPILIIPTVAILQTCRYFNEGPPDILERIILLCRPPLEFIDPQNSQISGNNRTSSNRENEGFRNITGLIFEDSPPKYTPPPSYTTATGAKLAQILRQSFRRSVRRIGNILSDNNITTSKSAISSSPPEYEY